MVRFSFKKILAIKKMAMSKQFFLQTIDKIDQDFKGKMLLLKPKWYVDMQ
jgi:hypothetical protein